jgi:succinoglycan biosynthesis protein ExoM
MLEACLDSLLAQIVPPDVHAEILVVDNNEEPDARPIVIAARGRSPFKIGYIWEPRRGIAIARNRVLVDADAHGFDQIAFIDDDETAAPDWLDGLMHPEYRGVPVLTGKRIHVAPEPQPFWHVPSARKDREGRKLGTATTCNVRFSRSLIDAGLRFNEAIGLGGGEDTELFAEARRAGFEIRRTDRAVTYEAVHPERCTYFGQMYREFWSGAVGARKSVLLRGPIRGTLLHNLPAVLTGVVGLAEMASSPLFMAGGVTAFKRRALSGGKKIGKGIGRAAGMFGYLPQPYRDVVGR